MSYYRNQPCDNPGCSRRYSIFPGDYNYGSPNPFLGGYCSGSCRTSHREKKRQSGEGGGYTTGSGMGAFILLMIVTSTLFWEWVFLICGAMLILYLILRLFGLKYMLVAAAVLLVFVPYLVEVSIEQSKPLEERMMHEFFENNLTMIDADGNFKPEDAKEMLEQQRISTEEYNVLLELYNCHDLYITFVCW